MAGAADLHPTGSFVPFARWDSRWFSTQVWSGDAAVHVSIVNWEKNDARRAPGSADFQPAASGILPVGGKAAALLVADTHRDESGATRGSPRAIRQDAESGGQDARAPLRLLTFQRGDPVDSPWETYELPVINPALSIGIDVTGAQALAAKAPQTIEEFETTYAQILDDALAANPGIKFVLCEPFVLPVGGVKNRWEDWRREIRARAAVVEKLAAKHKAPVVHFQKLFDDACANAPANYWTLDGVHPTFSGHQLMAGEWIRAVGKSWPEAAR